MSKTVCQVCYALVNTVELVSEFMHVSLPLASVIRLRVLEKTKFRIAFRYPVVPKVSLVKNVFFFAG